MSFLLIGVGLLFLIKGADFMISSASKIAKLLKIPAFIIGLIIVAFGTSAPEASIGIISGIQGTNQITLGDVVGSSIANILLVLGITTIVSPVKIDSRVPKKELPLSIIIQGLLILLVFTGHYLSRIEACLLCLGFCVFVGYIVLESKKVAYNEKPENAVEEDIFKYIEEEKVFSETIQQHDKCVLVGGKKDSLLRLSFLFLAGLAALIGGANMTVNGAVDLAHSIGLSEAFVGVTIIAIGTSLPEIISSLFAAIKKEDDIVVGNIIGSNIFNILFVLGLSVLIHPIKISADMSFDMIFMIASSIMLFIPAFLHGKLSRTTGFIFLSLYGVYIAIKLITLK